MNVPCLLVQMLSGAAGGNLACARFDKCKMGTVANSLLGLLGGFLGGQISLQLFASDMSASDMQLFLSCVGGGVLGGALINGIVGGIKTAWGRNRRS